MSVMVSWIPSAQWGFPKICEIKVQFEVVESMRGPKFKPKSHPLHVSLWTGKRSIWRCSCRLTAAWSPAAVLLSAPLLPILLSRTGAPIPPADATLACWARLLRTSWAGTRRRAAPLGLHFRGPLESDAGRAATKKAYDQKFIATWWMGCIDRVLLAMQTHTAPERRPAFLLREDFRLPVVSGASSFLLLFAFFPSFLFAFLRFSRREIISTSNFESWL